MADSRKVSITFSEIKNTQEEIESEQVEITEEFDPESINSREMQQNGWQAILNNFKKYVEEN